MSNLYLGTDVEQLASRLARNLDQAARSGDFFAPTTIVVPHRPLGQWLRLWLARQQGVAINLRHLYLEAALWELLKEVDPRPQDPAPELLDGDHYRLLVLSVLQENQEPGLDFWNTFLNPAGAGAGPSRLLGRRLWHLADHLASLIRDYEYHRQHALIQHWLVGELGLDSEHANLEKAQQTIFAAITRLPDGKRARLNDALQRNFKTLPQYAMEVMDHFRIEKLRPPAKPRRTVHLFGLTQMSMLHAHTLQWLGRFFDLQVYHHGPLANRLSERPTSAEIAQVAGTLREHSTPGDVSIHELIRAWGRAGAESLHAMAQLCQEPRYFSVERLTDRQDVAEPLLLFQASKPSTVLSRLQSRLLHGEQESPRQPPDTSLQMVGCPGRTREVETVYQSILANLQQHPDLRQSDIAVLATDMNAYRPILQAVFERRERTIRFSLADFSAAGVSVFGQALLDMLDLALGAFTRSRVCELLLNPCFLARLGIDRGQALVWLDWVDALGIYQGWNESDKKERGYADSPMFAWELGLKRLRLGRIMEVGREDGSEPAPRFGKVIPFADLHSGDPEDVNVFCQAVGGLLPRLARLRSAQGTAERWVADIEALARDFLAIPEDRPEETAVQERLLAGLRKWLIADHLGSEPAQFSLALVREMVVSLLEGIDGVRGQYAAGGVTIAALAPLKPMPLRIVYIVGLGEDTFPGSDALSGLDLRDFKSQPGDIRPAQFNRYLLLETLLAVKDKLYLLYNNLDVQKDQVLHPCVPLQQLKHYLDERILDRECTIAEVPLLPNDEAYLKKDGGCPGSDVLAQFDAGERLLAVSSARAHGELELSEQQAAELEHRLKARQVAFSLADVPREQADRPPTLTVRKLARYLENPAAEGIKYHLRINEEEDVERADDEPFVSDKLTGDGLIRQTLDWFVRRAVEAGLDQALTQWRQRFHALYEEWGLRGNVPEDAFGLVDRAALEKDLERRIIGTDGLHKFLRSRPAATFCGPILIGESPTPIGARTRFPALDLAIKAAMPAREDDSAPASRQVRLTGAMPLAWRRDDRFEILVWCFQNIGGPSDYYRFILEPVLFYMALRAAATSLESGDISSTWLADRRLVIHVAGDGQAKQITLGPNDISADIAHSYLANLARDFLDPCCNDDLPLRKIIKNPELKKAIRETDANVQDLRATFQEQLIESLESDFNDFSSWSRRQADFLDLSGAAVPADAFDKVRRRFRPLKCYYLL